MWVRFAPAESKPRPVAGRPVLEIILILDESSESVGVTAHRENQLKATRSVLNVIRSRSSRGSMLEGLCMYRSIRYLTMLYLKVALVYFQRYIVLVFKNTYYGCATC